MISTTDESSAESNGEELQECDLHGTVGHGCQFYKVAVLVW
jgi:hypothetical protein